MNHFPWDEIPNSNVFPAGTFQFAYTKLEDGQSQSTSKRMFRAQFTCIAPPQLAGMVHFENFVTGNDENLGGIVPGSMGTRSLKQSLVGAQIPPQSDPVQICQLVNATTPMLMIGLSKYEEKSGEYAGQERNRVTGYFKVGEKDVQMAPVAGGGGGPMARPAAAPAASAPPVTTPMAPQAVAPAPTPAPVAAPAPVAPAPTAPMPTPGMAAPAMPTPGVEAATTQAAPAMPTPAVAAPVAAPTQPVAPAAPAANPAAPPEQTINCTVCKVDVPMSQFSQHVQDHQNQG